MKLNEKKILIVDNSIDCNYLAKEMLPIYLGVKKENIITVTTSAEAIELAKKQLFDVIVIEEGLPGMSGTEAIQKIREQYKDNSPQVIGYINPWLKKEYKEYNEYNDTMIKPVPNEEFIEKIFEALLSSDILETVKINEHFKINEYSKIEKE